MSPPREFTYAAHGWAQLESEICTRLSLSRESAHKRRLLFMDTFDWRIYQAGFVLARIDGVLELSDRETGATVARAAASSNSAENGALPSPLRGRLSGVLGVRALSAVAAVNSDSVVLAARNDDAKTVARLVLSASYADSGDRQMALSSRLSVVPLRGYDKYAARLSEELSKVSGVEPMAGSLFEEAVAAAGRQPGDYTSKLALNLSREAPAYDSAKLIYRTLLSSMRVNHHGLVEDLDTEFLHDFRVAVRRTRSALKELPGALPDELESRFREDFRWLGQVTTPTRDLDVFLLGFPAFTEMVGDVSADLDPLRRLLIAERHRAHARLCTSLRSDRYRRLSEDWNRAVAAEAAPVAGGPAGTTAIGQLADTRIRKVAQHVLRDGSRIDDDSPAESLHDLRKRCKELRYLLEFFSSLYDQKLHRSLVQELKVLQLNLGQFQDTEVQRCSLEEFAERLLRAGDVPAAGLLAIGRLLAVLEEQQRRARAEFTSRFAAFASVQNRRRLADLTGAVE